MRSQHINSYRLAALLFLVLAIFVARAWPGPSLAQIPIRPSAKFPSFTCGPHLLTYEVYSANGQRGQGVRCVKVVSLSRAGGRIQFDFAWYGEGNWGTGSYRHIGYAMNDGEFNVISASDIFGNGEKSNASHIGTLDNAPTNIKLKQIVGGWPTPTEIHLDGAWKEVWKRVSATTYMPLPKIATCGPHFKEYEAQLFDPKIVDRGIRCLSKASYVWFGSGKWGNATYAHIGIGGWTYDNQGALIQLSPTAEASDICDRKLSTFCNATPQKGIQFTQQGNNIRAGGVWNELWVPK